MKVDFPGKKMAAWRNGRARIQANRETHTTLYLRLPFITPQEEVTGLKGQLQEHPLGVTEEGKVSRGVDIW